MEKIMVVDDEVALVSLLTQMLEKEGFEVIQAHSGKECLEKLEVERPDLILLDIMMPGLSGWEVLEEIGKREDLNSIPVCMLTVKDLTEDTLTKESIKGLIDYVTKPFSREALISRIRGNLKAIAKIKEVKDRLLEIDPSSAEEYERLMKLERLHQNLLATLRHTLEEVKVGRVIGDVVAIDRLIENELNLINLYEKRKSDLEALLNS